MDDKNELSSRGSEWRKWDLQVHTPESHLNSRFGDDWDGYVQALFRAAIAKDIAVIGLTDYFTIDGYKKLRQQYLSRPEKLATLFEPRDIARIKSIRVFPNIEFRLNKLVGPNRINCHVILSDEVDIRDIEENFLHDLSFVYEGEPQATAEKLKLKVDNLRRLGARLIREHDDFAGYPPLFIGMKNAVVDENDILEALKDHRFKNKYLFGVVADEDLSKIKWDSQDHLTRKVLIQCSDVLFSSNPSTRNWALGRKPQYGSGEIAFIEEFKSLKPCVHGSDCHEHSEIGHPCAYRGKQGHFCKTNPEACDLRYCWIKADTTFEGLRQIIHEPADRVFIGPSPPEYHDTARVISSVSLRNSNGWFGDIDIPLNPSMISIIGQKGSGKSALADLIAFAAGSWDSKDNASFLNRADGYLDGARITLTWADDRGRQSHGIIGQPPNSDNEVHYLSQNYVEKICAKDGISKELVREIEKVIFHYLDPADTLNAADFDDLRAMKTESIREEGARLREEIGALIRDECALREQRAKLPEKVARAKTLRTEREGLVKQMPKPATPEEKKAQEELQAKRSALANLQQQIATLKQTLQRVVDVRHRVNTFKTQMESFYAQLEPVLRSIGIAQTDWRKFAPMFQYDLETVLASREQEVNALVSALEGAEPPADGTIKKVQAEMAELMKFETADTARQNLVKQIQTRIATIDSELQRLDAEIKVATEEAPNRLTAFVARRLDTYIDYFKNLELEQKTLQGLYEPIQEKLREQALLQGKELSFSIRWAVDLSSWLERGTALFDQRRAIPYGTFAELSEAARKILVPAWTSSNPERIRAEFDKYLEEFRNPAWRSFLRNGITVRDVLAWLFEVDHISLEYGLRFNGADLENLSPGTKGIVLLILYLGMDTEDTRPLIVDQPDENLDNESIYNLLTPYFRTAKTRRQIIVITHNPNLVVNSDSEQVLVASAEKRADGLPSISYQSGSLENNYPPERGIRQQVCKILEGGDTAFLKRERRYAIKDSGNQD